MLSKFVPPPCLALLAVTVLLFKGMFWVFVLLSLHDNYLLLLAEVCSTTVIRFGQKTRLTLKRPFLLKVSNTRMTRTWIKEVQKPQAGFTSLRASASKTAWQCRAHFILQPCDEHREAKKWKLTTTTHLYKQVSENAAFKVHCLKIWFNVGIQFAFTILPWFDGWLTCWTINNSLINGFFFPWEPEFHGAKCLRNTLINP